MATLHMLSHSPFEDGRLESCLRLLGNQDAVLLCGDAVYALQQAGAPWASLQQRAAQVFALAEDVSARAIDAHPSATLVDYPAFVQLSLDYDKVNSWL